MNARQWRVIWAVAVVVLGLWLAGAPWNMAIASREPRYLAHDAVKTPSIKKTMRQIEFEIMALASDQQANIARQKAVADARTDLRNRLIMVLLVVGGLVVWQLGGGNQSNKD